MKGLNCICPSLVMNLEAMSVPSPGGGESDIYILIKEFLDYIGDNKKSNSISWCVCEEGGRSRIKINANKTLEKIEENYDIAIFEINSHRCALNNEYYFLSKLLRCKGVKTIVIVPDNVPSLRGATFKSFVEMLAPKYFDLCIAFGEEDSRRNGSEPSGHLRHAISLPVGKERKTDKKLIASYCGGIGSHSKKLRAKTCAKILSFGYDSFIQLEKRMELQDTFADFRRILAESMFSLCSSPYTTGRPFLPGRVGMSLSQKCIPIWIRQNSERRDLPFPVNKEGPYIIIDESKISALTPEWVNNIILGYEERSKLIDCEIDHYYGYDKFWRLITD